jgi:hypothetical protein
MDNIIKLRSIDKSCIVILVKVVLLYKQLK